MLKNPVHCHIALYCYQLPLIGQAHPVKEGLFFILETEQQYSYGEYAPHPATFQTPLATLERALVQLCDAGSITVSKLSPPLQWGFVMALSWLFPEIGGWNLPNRLPIRVPLNGLITDLRTALQPSTSVPPYSTFKLKIGRLPVDEEIALIQQFHQQYPDVQLRLDANQRLSFDQAKRLLTALRGLPIEYVEDPTADSEEYPALFHQTGIPIALDETLTSSWLKTHSASPLDWLAALVIKPPRYGDLTTICHLVATAHQHHIPLVLSAAYESTLTLHWLALVHASLNPTSVAAGLDTFRIFTEHLSPWEVRNGTVVLRSYRPEPSTLAWDRSHFLGRWHVQLYWDAQIHR